MSVTPIDLRILHIHCERNTCEEHKRIYDKRIIGDPFQIVTLQTYQKALLSISSSLCLLRAITYILSACTHTGAITRSARLWRNYLFKRAKEPLNGCLASLTLFSRNVGILMAGDSEDRARIFLARPFWTLCSIDQRKTARLINISRLGR